MAHSSNPSYLRDEFERRHKQGPDTSSHDNERYMHALYALEDAGLLCLTHQRTNATSIADVTYGPDVAFVARYAKCTHVIARETLEMFSGNLVEAVTFIMKQETH